MKNVHIGPDDGDGETTTSEGLLHESMELRPPIEPPAPPDEGMDLVVDLEGRILSGPPLAPSPESDPIAAEADWPAEVREANTDPKKRFAHFTLVAQVGCGGSGAVYRAWDSRAGSYSGLKILHSMEPTALERFTREARIAASLKHPAIATTYEVGEHAGRWYIAMKYIDGRPIDAEPRPIEHNLGLIRDACRALDYAHRQGIIHRDIKPANLLVDRQGRVYLTDFGVAKKLDHEHTTSLSMTGSIIGTPKYLPPEQARGEAKRADARSDVYSLGATLYKLLAGRAPFSSCNVWETIESVIKKDPPPLTALNPKVSPELERVVARAMAKHPAGRFATAGEMGDELERLLVERRFTGRYGLPLYLARKWAPITAAGVAAALIFTWIAPSMFPGASAEETDPDAAHYKRAAMALLRLEESDDLADPERRSRRIREFNDSEIANLQGRMPDFIHAKVLKIRASYIGGAREPARRELLALSASEPADYRIRFLRALIHLEEALAAPLPLPAPEAPAAEWDGPEPDWRRFHADLQEVARAPVDEDSLLFAEHRRDAAAALALQPLVEGQWARAHDELKKLTSVQRLPVYAAAQRAAAYLARRFKDVTDIPGAQWALALSSNRPPDEDLERLRPRFAGDARRESTLLAWAARRWVARGGNPQKAVEEGLALAGAETAAGREVLGILHVARLRWLARSGRDAETDYGAAQGLLGPQPSTWMGRLASAEALLGLGRFRKLRGGEFRPAFEEVIARADSMSRDPGWPAPVLLRAEALLELGRFQEALSEAKGALASSADGPQACLVSSAASLRLADQARRAKSPKEADHQKDAFEFSERVVARLPDHPDALVLRSAAAIFAAEGAKEPGPLLAKAVERLTRALDLSPDFVEARFHRAAARFLAAESAGQNPGTTDLVTAALDDVDRVLKAVPELASARALRGILRASTGRHAESLEDLNAALNLGQFPDPEELKEWIRAAESAKEK